MPINTQHKEYTENHGKWSRIADCLDEDAIKENTAYLPKNKTQEDDEYVDYIERAFFYGVCSWTLSGMVGAAYRKPGVIEMPEALKYLSTNIDGSGNTAVEQSKVICSNALSFGRYGLLLDHPIAPSGLSKDEEAALNLRWNVIGYSPTKIINWRTKTIGASTVLSLVVLEDMQTKEKDDFEQKEVLGYRCLKLTDSGYQIDVWSPNVDSPKKDSDYTVVSHQPTANGKRIDFIPFAFIGADNNKPNVDKPPFLSLANANLSHYKNSADWEEAVFMTGRPTLYMSGMNNEHIETLKKNNMFPLKVGSRTMLPLPPGGQAGLIESVSDKTLIEKAMDRKERLMAMLGARMIEEKKQTESTETHKIRQGGQTSVLRNVVDNTEKAYRTLLGWAVDLSGESDTDFNVQLNHDFFESTLTAQEALQLTQVWQAGGFSTHDLHENFQKGGMISEDRDREDVDAELAEEVGNLPRSADEG